MKVLQKLAASAADLALICGGCLVALGAGMIYLPAGVMTAGALLILGGLVAARDLGGGEGA